MKQKQRGYTREYKRAASFLLFVIVFVLTWGYFLSRIDPDMIVAFFGLENTYSIMFVIALLGGISSISGPLIYTTLATFAFGGSHSLLLGVVCGFGVFLSDMFFYVLALQGGVLVPSRIRVRFQKIYLKLEKKRSWAIPYLIIVYTGFSFLPTDLLILTMALSHYSLRKAALPFFIGSMIHFTLLSYLLSHGYTFFF